MPGRHGRYARRAWPLCPAGMAVAARSEAGPNSRPVPPTRTFRDGTRIELWAIGGCHAGRLSCTSSW
jgi:hypothetical protein